MNAKYLQNGSLFHTSQQVRWLCKSGQLTEALRMLKSLNEPVSPETYACVLGLCSHAKALLQGRQVHAHLVKHGVDSDIYIGNVLIHMYIKCGSLTDAIRWSNQMPARDIYTWTLLIKAHAKEGNNEEALKMFSSMELEGEKPNKVTFLTVVKLCTTSKQGKLLHSYIIEGGYEFDDYLSSSLLGMYAKYGNLEDAYNLFTRVPNVNVAAWNIMIAGYAQHEMYDLAFFLFWKMPSEGVVADEFTYLSILKACARLGDIREGQNVHDFIIKVGNGVNISVANTLLDMYVKCNSINDASFVFNRLLERDVASWTAMLAGYVQEGHCYEALCFFQKMQLSGMKPNKVTYISVLKACAFFPSLQLGYHVHMNLTQSHYDADLVIRSSLIDMYLNCESVEDAYIVFSMMPSRDIVIWNTMIKGYAESEQGEECLELFQKMLKEDMEPDELTFLSILKACAMSVSLEKGRQLHSFIVECGFELDIRVASILIEMYGECSCMIDARHVFDNSYEQHVFAWTALITGFVENGYCKEGLRKFDQMQKKGVTPGEATFPIALKACANLTALEQGRELHALIAKLNYQSSVQVANTLVDMYAKCGSINDARHTFDAIPEKNVISHNSMLHGFLQEEHCEDAIGLFWHMQNKGLKADKVTYVGALKACATLTLLELGTDVHGLALRCGFLFDTDLQGTLVDMYAKCGSITQAKLTFDAMLEHDLVASTVMLAGFAQHGLAEDAFQLFHRLQSIGVELDEAVFTNILCACIHAGLVDEGLHIFYLMTSMRMAPTCEHYACLVDLLGRAGCVDYAAELVRHMPLQPSAVVWTAFFGCCKQYRHLSLENHFLECILELEPGNAIAVVLLSNINWTDDT